MSFTLSIRQRVEVKEKNVQGEVAYIGMTEFASGKWIGIILDEPKGKNNGTVKGKTYFKCKENHGTFVRQTQLSLITETGSRIDLSNISTPEIAKPSRRLSNSRQSLVNRFRYSKSREDISSTPTSAHTTPEPLAKHTSLVETEFVETLNPQFTPSIVVNSPSVASSAQSNQTIHALMSQQKNDNNEITSLKEQNKDLSEKLETLRIKFKEKNVELDNFRLQLEQSIEFKNKIIEQQSSLKKELEKTKREKQEAVEAREDLAEMADTLEMATLDREMAEEKAELLQRDLDHANDRVTELEIEVELLKADLTKKAEGYADSPSSNESILKVKQLELQNEKLKDTLVKLRDLSAHEKYEKQKLDKEFEQNKSDLEALLKSKEKLKNQIDEMEEQISELHANVDAALGAEEMVETLGQQKLSLEDRVKELQEAVAELEELQEINDQLQEGFKEQEQDFRQELDMKNLAVWDAQRKTEQVLETLTDRELTIVKFRELVQRIQEENHELRIRLDKTAATNMMQTPPELLDFKKMFAETKAHARAIDLKLRHMEVDQAQQHVKYLIAFMPDSFLARGSDNDAVLLVLLMPRLLTKCKVLLSQLRDKFPPVDNIDKATLDHTVHQFAARSRFSMYLHMLTAVLHQFVHGLNTCSPETLLKAGGSYPDIIQQEKVLDGYLELLKRDQLDENVNTENLERCINFFNTIHPLLLLQNKETSIHQGQLLADLGKAVLSGVDSLATDSTIIKVLLQQGTADEELNKLIETINTWCEITRQHLRGLRRQLLDSVLDLPGMPSLDLVVQQVAKIAKILAPVARGIPQTQPDTTLNSGLANKVMELLTLSFEKYCETDKETRSTSPTAYFKSVLESLSVHIANISLTIQENEDKFTITNDKKSNITPPLVIRAKSVKDELNATANLRKLLEQREANIKELKITIRSKQEEIGEMMIRKELAEKKLSSITKEHELAVQNLQRRYEETQVMLKKKEKDFEETMDHLQKDIDSLEMEKGELKEKIKTLPKKSGVSYDVIATTTAATGIYDDSVQNLKVVESPILINEIRTLRTELNFERSKRIELEAKHYSDILKNLKPIFVPKLKNNETDFHRVEADIQRIDALKKKIYDYKMDYVKSLPQIFDLSKKKPGQLGKSFIQQHFLKEAMKEKHVKEKYYELQKEVGEELLRMKKGHKVETDLTIFPSPEMVAAINKSQTKIMEISFPTKDEELCGKKITLNVETDIIKKIKETMLKL